MTTYSYSLAAKFCSEFVGMTFTIFLGEGILANELLPSTKGHGMGLLAVALGFGLAFGVNIAWFGAISAHLNPAMFFFLACLNKLQDGWTEFVVGSVASFLGAFVGACGVYVFFSPHFALLPAPPDDNPTTTLVQGAPNALETNAGRIASAFGELSRKPPGTNIVKEFSTMFTGTNVTNAPLRKEYDASQRQALLEKMEICHQRRVQFRPTVASYQDEEAKEELSDRPLLERRHSVQVAALLHTHDQPSTTSTTPTTTLTTRSTLAGVEMEEGQLSSSLFAKSTTGTQNNNSNNNNNNKSTNPSMEVPPPDKNNDDDNNKNENQQHTNINTQKTDAQIAYEAALQADAHAKLAIFATRPALYNRPLNFLQELLATCMLVLGAELFHLRLEFDTTTTTTTTIGIVLSKDGASMLIKTLWVSLYIAALILGLGGTTGLAVNPARDIGPWLAHYVLPVPNKGSSEWDYRLAVPLVAPFVGAALGAALYRGLEALYESGSIVTTGSDEL